MCGIVGYIGNRDAVEVAMNGLRRLEYRGYDSAGIACITGDGLRAVKSPGKLAALEQKLDAAHLAGTPGIGHTRWATHGAPTERNAHPHLDEAGRIAVVHNGIIENHRDLHAGLKAEGVVFRSDTDSEVLPHLIRSYYEGDLFEAVHRTLQVVRGAYAIAVVSVDDPDVLVAARQGSPLILAYGDGEHFVASDVPAIMQYTRTVTYLDDGQICRMGRNSVRIEDLRGHAQTIKVDTVDWDEAAAEKGGYEHFMLKEIHEQPDVMRTVLRNRIDERGDVHFELADLDPNLLKRCSKIVIVACGTAWHAGLVGRRLIESIARIPVEIDIASEYRYRSPIVPPGTLVIPISQSGETADTMEAVRVAQEAGAIVTAIVNVVGSSIARMADGVIHTYAGPEIGVASTKAYTSQLTALTLFAIYLARRRETMDHELATVMLDELRAIPDKLLACVDREPEVREIAARPKYTQPRSAFFMGRGYNYPSALEGALKLKEISYIHAEGYAAGEMKHGPIALITDEVPMIAIATQSPTYEKVISNIQEIRARNGIMLSIATDGDEEAPKHSDDVLYVPACPDPLSPILNAVPLQLLAYHIAVNRGCDVDQPRNLAKSVTVE